MTAIVDHATVHDLTVQGNQAARSRALTHLLEISGLPTVSTWSIEDMTDRLTGRIYANYDENLATAKSPVPAAITALRSRRSVAMVMVLPCQTQLSRGLSA